MLPDFLSPATFLGHLRKDQSIGTRDAIPGKAHVQKHTVSRRRQSCPKQLPAEEISFQQKR